MTNLLSMPALQSDAAERRFALETGRSWIVEAPAGSGKTALLIQRHLALLASPSVVAPEEVLAITFTRAATEEIRERLLGELRSAAVGLPANSEYAAVTRSLAQDVLERDHALGWNLLAEPRRLRVQTIDGVCAEIARSLPVLSGGMSALTPVEDARPLYREAARRTLLRLGMEATEADRRVSDALRRVLLHRDGDLAACESLIAEMLASRDQWSELILPNLGELSDDTLEAEIRPRLDRALDEVVCEGLRHLLQALPPNAADVLAGLATELSLAPAHDLSSQHPFFLCRDLVGAPEAKAQFLEHWKALLRLLVQKSGKWRKGFARNSIGATMERHQSKALNELIRSIEGQPGLLDTVHSCLALPSVRYPDDQWAVASALLRVLERGVRELAVVFAQRGVCDFVEPALMAQTALDRSRRADTKDAYGRSESSGDELKHLLVDEMQDTSSRQYRLLESLTGGWDGRSKTVFLVGDPKQSIYLFRQARVERFLEAMQSKRLGSMSLGRIRLTANFRSTAGMIAAANETFREIFPKTAASAGEVEYVAAVAPPGADSSAENAGYAWRLTLRSDGDAGKTASLAAQAKRNAASIRRTLEQWQAKPWPAGRTEPWKLAVLVQSRRSLDAVVRELRAGEPVPFRAVDIEELAERREVLDLLALTRALAHPADRIAWLAVLHAPWCGLGLSDLHVLTGCDAPEFANWTMLDLVAERGTELGAESIARLERVWPILRRAVALAGELRVPELVERTWRSLGGDRYLVGAAAANAQTFLKLLRRIDHESGHVDVSELRRRMERLYAAPETGPSSVDLMTIHGAKGLEWDAVIVPELERAAPQPKTRLLEWEELPNGRGVVFAPIAGKGEASQALHRWLRRLHTARETAERKRLFYVACTRARQELHLYGTVLQGKQESSPNANSLLEVAWPAARQHLSEESRVSEAPEPHGLSLAAAADGDSAGAGAEGVDGAVRDASDEERPAMLERVPADFTTFATPAGGLNGAGEDRARVLRSPELQAVGSASARALGNVVHAMLEYAAQRFADGTTAEQLRQEAADWQGRHRALLRAEGLPPREVDAQADRVRLAVNRTLLHPIGLWILQARTEARSEFPLTTWIGERRVYRIDRVFRGGDAPGETGDCHRWIIDYKTASHGREGLEAFLDREQAKYDEQLERYAAALGDTDPRLGLWFPLLGQLRWWRRGRSTSALRQATLTFL